MRAWLAAVLVALGLSAAATSSASAQVDPRGAARTLRSEHFRVHFSPEHEALARRAVAYAESAWVQLAQELAEPDAPVELLVGDNLDVSNGFATTFPTNRITVFALPPHMVPELRHYDDWLQLVITHELAHVFHIDRARGLWSLGRKVLGRNPALMPNAFLPSWVIEGLAVHYEAKFTGSGRLVSSEWPMLARAAAVRGRVPPVHSWSLTSSRFPLGQHAYGYGAMLMSQLAAREDSGMRRFVDAVASHPIPWRLDRNARAGFGVSFTEAARGFRDSLGRVGDSVRARAAGDTLRLLRAPGMTWFAAQPRWQHDSALLVSVNDGQDVAGLYRAQVQSGGLALERLSRRNSLDATAIGPDGTLTWTQLDFDDPFVLRSRLWRTDANGRESRLGDATRLFLPDVRTDGAVVAVRALAGTTELVRVQANGDVRTLTPASLDTAYTEPRWSPRGDRLVAVRLLRGGAQQVVLLDTTGRVTDVVSSARGIASVPTFTPDGARVVWSGDRTGALQLEVGEAREDGGRAVRTLTRSLTGVASPAVSPNGQRVAALEYTLDGWQLVVLPMHDGYVDEPRMPGTRAYADTSRSLRITPDTSRAESYSPWRQLVPRWWMPVVGEGSDGGATFGVSSSGLDIRRRHAWAAQLTRHPSRGEHEGSAVWRYSALPAVSSWQPFVDANGVQYWDRFAVIDSARRPIGELQRRSQVVGAGLTLSRPRVRTSSSFTVGAQYEMRRFGTSPDTLLGGLDPIYARGTRYPSVYVSGSWANTMRAGRAISLEDGVGITGTVQRRWRDDRPGLASYRSTVAARAYKAFDWGGFSRHALAVRAAAGLTDRDATSELSLGGTSGTLAELVPGVLVGDPARLFPVRGFAPGVQRGSRVVATAFEYRAPLAMPARGVGLVPLFLDRTSVTFFGDAGRAWCDGAVREGAQAGVVCLPPGVRDGWLASVGAELALDLGVQWDAPYRVRLGWAQPVARPADVSRQGTLFFTLGSSF
jgi:hypothetical protein